MGQSKSEDFYGTTDWFLAADAPRNTLVIGFDQEIDLEQDPEEFNTELEARCARFDGPYGVVIWFGPDIRNPSKACLRHFETLTDKLDMLGADLIGVVRAAGSDISMRELRRYAHGQELMSAPTITEMEALFDHARGAVNAQRRSGHDDDRAAAVAPFPTDPSRYC